MARKEKVLDLMQYPKSLIQINKMIQKVYPYLVLIRGEGYMYFSSEGDSDEAKVLHILDTTSVAVYSWREMRLGRWMEEAKEIDDKIQAYIKECDYR